MIKEVRSLIYLNPDLNKLFFGFCLLLCKTLTGQSSCNINHNNIRPGETLIYDVYYHWGVIWAHAGECTFSIKSDEYAGKASLHFVGEGKTFKSYDHFFKVRDRFDCWADTARLLPFRYIRNSQEGSTKVYNDNYFDYKSKTVKCYSVQQKKAELKIDTAKLKNCTYDVLSMIYYARCIDYSQYKKDQRIPISLYLDGKVHDSLYIRYKGKERIKSKTSEIQCIVFSPLLIKGTIFAGGEDMTVWATDDFNKTPVLIKSSIVIGEILVKLREVKNN